MTAALMVTALVTAGVYLILQRGLVRAAFGFVLIGHAANVIVLAAGGTDRREPAYVARGLDDDALADPLVQAFALTAIVITFALTVYMLALAGNGAEEDGPPSDAAPSDVSEDEGTVVDGPDTGSGEIGTQPAGDQPTGRTTGREHA